MNVEILTTHYDNMVNEILYQLCKNFIKASEKIFSHDPLVQRIGFMIDSESEDNTIKNRPFYLMLDNSDPGYNRLVFANRNKNFFDKTFNVDKINNQETVQAFNELFAYATLPTQDIYMSFVNFFDKKNNYMFFIEKEDFKNSVEAFLGSAWALRYEKEVLEENLNNPSHINNSKNQKSKIKV